MTALALSLILAGAAPNPPKTVDLTQQLLASMTTTDRKTVQDVMYYLSNPRSDRGAFWARQQRFIEECMRRAGFHYNRMPYTPLTVDLTGGYQPTPHPGPPVTQQPLSADRNAAGFAQQAWRETYSNSRTQVTFDLPGGGQGGSVTGGCLGESLRRIYGADLTPAIRADMVITNLLPMIIKMTIGSDEVQQATRRWRQCIRTTFPAAKDTTKLRPSTTAASPADGDCRRLTGLTAAYARRFPVTTHHVLRAHASVIADWYQLQSASRHLVAATTSRPG
ncbi:hypothetical protein [Micromonospora parva]|uniref:hypothetical protein n=1 Tax=Micromonospora parva TaxID=1464048 RepID=UPI0034112E27